MRRNSGLTLIEVMAAVAILGIVYTLLARAATEGVISEGDSRRRLEAAFLADQTLAELETQLAVGAAPLPGTSERQIEEFLLVIEVTPYALPAELLLDPLTGQPPAGAAGPGILGGAQPGAEGLLRRIAVRVQWDDGVFEQQLERVTYAYDVAQVGALAGAGVEAGELP